MSGIFSDENTDYVAYALAVGTAEENAVKREAKTLGPDGKWHEEDIRQWYICDRVLTMAEYRSAHVGESAQDAYADGIELWMYLFAVQMCRNLMRGMLLKYNPGLIYENIEERLPTGSREGDGGGEAASPTTAYATDHHRATRTTDRGSRSCHAGSPSHPQSNKSTTGRLL